MRMNAADADRDRLYLWCRPGGHRESTVNVTGSSSRLRLTCATAKMAVGGNVDRAVEVARGRCKGPGAAASMGRR